MRLSQIAVVLTLTLGLACWSCSGSDDEDKDMGVDTISADTRMIPGKPFGSTCTNVGETCKVPDPDGYKLICVALKGGPTGKGYCTRTCSDVGNECYGVPNGQMAGCFIESSDGGDSGPSTKYCGFLCRDTQGALYDCPPTLKCGAPNAQGQAVCLPK